MLKIIPAALALTVGLAWSQVEPSDDPRASSPPAAHVLAASHEVVATPSAPLGNQDCGTQSLHSTGMVVSGNGFSRNSAGEAKRKARQDLKAKLAFISQVECDVCLPRKEPCNMRVNFTDPGSVAIGVTGTGPWSAVATYIGGFIIICDPCTR